ncbi:MAG TPA: D-aminoacyl-tRNA deacylase [SAR324 cluster bacterium]|jgi:D-tyrosyl-tRNA(Tyr) deacylase|nr:D-tyrosyl-tRNA(Tyr) deacylase [Deltaproteobacteria bacterium]MDP6090760.1 D-aminoacyl-tRNA deacylase [SAR324 cluster bacterium]MDP6245245.1 D-aminoacyl-tRNA deacylase [SAR324 cluster bacterium]MDP6330826.1 D-aminoacyl-tRNA deacylase [SAR324 cluster bacterium]MDP6728692.1 D-aminoacyl-tRNA deacylase [SAR324 cluster bacterium]|tara:strand:- start:11 stop:466 length:456 start_codon:yes stop_codon:yes gene_type:complete
MRVLLQRVCSASVEVEGKMLSEISRGLLLFVGITHQDDPGIANQLAKKCAQLRIFEDEQQRQHQCSALDLNLEALVVSQFTLYGNTNKGRRPGFDQSAPPQKAETLYETFIECLRNTGLRCASGKFRAEMKVSLINDGPVTYLLEKENKTS